MPPPQPKEDAKTERFNMFLSQAEAKAIDEWAWENRIRSKSEAVRQLIKLGLGLTGVIQERKD